MRDADKFNGWELSVRGATFGPLHRGQARQLIEALGRVGVAENEIELKHNGWPAEFFGYRVNGRNIYALLNAIGEVQYKASA